MKLFSGYLLKLYETLAVSAALGVLIILSGFFSAAETAFTGFSAVKMKRLAKNSRRARLVLELNNNYGDVLTTLLIGNNIVNILATSLATVLFSAIFQGGGVTLSTLVMTALVLVFGEVSPKTVAKEFPEEFAMFSAPAIKVCMCAFSPLCRLFAVWKRLLAKIFRFNKKNKKMTEEEFGIIVSDIADEGVLPREEQKIILNALRYGETKVASVMIPAENITYIDKSESINEIKRKFADSNYSRIPVASGGLSRVLGILYRVDFYEMLINGRSDIFPLIKPAFYCKPTDNISELLKIMQGARRHLAIVADGSRVAGLITVEDITAQLVGEIQDRYDSVPENPHAPPPAE